MEHKPMLLTAFGVGVGLGASLGLSSGLVGGGNGEAGDELYGEQIEQELLRQVIDGKECKETFQEFPYYLSERTRELLKSAASVHLRQLFFSKHTRNLSPASRAILLSGPAEFYIQTLAKALAHHFDSKLLLLDVADFSSKIQSKYGCASKESSSKISLSEVASQGVSDLIGSVLSSNGKTKGTFQKHSNATGSPNITSNLRGATACQSAPADSAKQKSSLCINEKLFMQLLYKVLVSVSEKSSIILYIRDADKIFLQSEQLYNLFNNMLGELRGPVLILASKIAVQTEKLGNLPPWVVLSCKENKCSKVDERLAGLFPYIIKIKPPEDENDLEEWKAQLEENKKTIKSQDNRNHIAAVLVENDVECRDLNSISHEDTKILGKHVEEIVLSAISYYLMNTKDPEYRNQKLVISSESLSHGLDLFRKKESSDKGKKQGTSVKKQETRGKKEVRPDNQHEGHIREELIPANEIGVTFSDIGALEEIKESLQELVMLPIRRPELFKGGLLKPCRGILLFGPPGTGKTMLAKAIANEAGASFINVSMSTITSKCFGESEKHVRALFSLAAKVSPTIIFIDEVDSLLGSRARCGEHEVTRRIKNEFMTHWDGLLTKQDERILVLAATNRPFDLDDAIIRRFERRIMVGLPSVESREIILKTLLSKEDTENLDLKEIAVMTEGYTGSDLKNLCTAAAYRPVRELIKQGKLEALEKNKEEAEGQNSKAASSAKEDTKEKNKSDMCMDEEFFMQLLYKVVVSVSEKSSIILYIRDVNRIFLESEQLYKLFQEILEKLSGPILILGSQITDIEDEWSEDELLGNEWLPCFVPPPEAGAEVDERIAALFPYNIQIKPPKDEHNLQNWKTQLEGDKKTIQSQDNQNHIAQVLAEMDVECKDLNSINHEDTEVLSKHIEEIAVSAVSYYLMNTKDPEYHNGKLVISSESLCHSLGLFRKTNTVNDTQKTETDGKKEVPPDNNYEANMRSELIPANQIGVTFADIGALEEVKESLQELIMLPLRRPELFKGGLLKPCRGILLFGPPGTGKTMLAKAIAHEAGASFINVPMSAITSMWYGEAEKNVRAIFTLAAKVSPTIIFIDEVDSLLGQRARCGEHEATRRIKNEFMTHWDGLLTKQDERILVLAATNRPFDLDDAIIRRFQRRFMVGLPSVETREIILKTMLAKENTEKLDFKELAIMTEGYTGSDLKNLCTAAAYRPVKELIKQERLKDMEKNKNEAEGQSSEAASSAKEDTNEKEKNKKDAEGQGQSSKADSSAKENKEDPVTTLRPINMEDMIQAKNQVPPSFDDNGLIMRELQQWNKLYGERVLL
ncbi:uncharacterized protein LOC114749156 [Neltuma alba]|uniref:uncharacterized protein LOC114749156 n=1 Tax=Neltuma alba TaxID=207710 RepID=UPI0010A4ACE5|nr:uncharacterized protein LOC114749156 [Prosopis alba]